MLMSGGYDLSVVISGSSLHEVASFVAEKLSTLEGVISTATHFQLKTYKSNGFLARVENSGQRLPVSP
jgi:DNA-binding Lrp family transcriptional regulator